MRGLWRALVGLPLAGALFFCASAGLASAATVAERSPFTQGQWWDPTRSGQGFELFNVGNQGMAIWFTFDDQRNPIWYTAQGELGTRWTLNQHQWASTQRGATVAVGTLQVTFRDDSQADLEFELRGRTGKWRIEPFMPGAKTNDVDRSGSYFDAANPGWGYTLTEQGDVLGGVLYAYNPSGFPTWVAGFARESNGSVPVVSVRGPCPGCDAAPTERFDAGRLEIDLLSDRQVALRTTVLQLPTAPGLSIHNAVLSQLGRPAADRPADRVLASFSAQSLKEHVARVLPNMAFFGSTPGVTFPVMPLDVPERSLRLQDSGADECDTVKSSERHAYTFGHDGVTREMAYLRVAEIGRDGVSLDVRPETVPLASGFNTPTFTAALCLSDDALVSIAGTQPYSEGSPRASAVGYMKGRTYVEIFGLADPARPASRWWAEFDGHMLTSFRIGSRLYVVLRHAPTVQGLDYRFLESSEAVNREVLAAAPLEALTPQVRPNGGSAVAMVSPSSTYLTPSGSRRRPDFIVVVAIDLREARIVDSLALLGSVERVHLSGYDLVLAGTARPGAGVSSASRTHVHQVRLGLQGMSVVGTGLVEGLVGADALQATAAGQLRVVSRVGDGFARLTILDQGPTTPGFLRASDSLPNASRPASIEAGVTRFAGDRLYVASAGGQLTAVDLATPQGPVVIGTLATRGALESLHPLQDGRLVTTGHEVGFFGTPSPLHITLYDVQETAGLRELQRVRIGTDSTTPLMAEPFALVQVQRPDAALSLAFPARVPTSAGAIQNGVVHFELRDSRFVAAGFVRRADFIPPGMNPAFPGTRVLVLPEALIYISAGQFWRQDASGNVTGPF